MVTDVQPGGGEPTAESRVRNSFPGENSHHESKFERSHEGRGGKQKPDLSLIKLEGFEVITHGKHEVKAPTEETESSSSEAATTSMSSSSSMVTSSSKDFSPATNPLLTTGVFSETTLSEIEEEVVTLQPSGATLDEEVVTKKEQDFESEEDEEAIEGEVDSEDSDELSDYFYSIYGDEYPFDYADYLNYSDEDFEESIISPGSPVKTFTVGHESVKGELEK